MQVATRTTRCQLDQPDAAIVPFGDLVIFMLQAMITENT
jgi:hypothetical protein